MYGKIFDSMYTGTLYGQWQAIITFQQMIVLCDADGIIDMTPPGIAAITSIPLEIIQKGIEVLSSPDPYTRTPGSEGRRIELIDSHRPWGWRIVNHEKYKSLQDADTVRAQTRERVRKHREEKEKRSVTVGNVEKRYTDTDTNTDTKTNTTSKPTPGAKAPLRGFDVFWLAYPNKKSKGQAENAWRRIKPDEQLHNRILDALEQAKKSEQWCKDGGQFIPHPATWLNAKGWEDEHSQQQTAVKKPRAFPQQ